MQFRPYFLSFFVSAFTLLLVPIVANAAPFLGDLTIPPSRVPDWYLPTLVNTSNWTVVPVHAVNCADNTTEDATVIRNAISAASPNTILQLDANCTYNIQAGALALNKSNLVIRGGGMDSTILQWGHSTGGTPCYISPPNMFGSGMGGSALMWICTTTPTETAVNWTAGYTRGTTDITVANDATFAVGDWIGARAAWSSEFGIGNEEDIPALLSARNMHLAKITAKRPGGAVNVLRLDRPLRNDFSNNAVFQQVINKWHPLENSGIESLTVRPYDAYTAPAILMIANVASVWISDVRADGGNQVHINITRTARSLLDRVYFNDIKYTPHNEGSVGFQAISQDNVVQNSIFIRNGVDLRAGIGSSGNAWIYNYQRRLSTPRNCDGSGGTGTAAERASLLHGLVNEFLLEGNDSECQSHLDNWWGTQAYRNTFYRNRQGVVTMSNPAVQGWGFGNMTNSLIYPVGFSSNYMLNSVTRFYKIDYGINSNFDDVSNAPGTFNLWLERNLIQGALNLIPRPDTTSVNNVASALTTQGVGDWGSKNFPASLIYTSKPSWWTISSPWPAIGADVDVIGGVMHKLPAQCRYEGSTTGDCAPAGTVITPPTDTTSPILTLSSSVSSITPGSTVTLTLSSNETLNSSGVSFYQGSTLIGTDTTSNPYSFTWTAPSVTGNYSLSAQGRDTSNNLGTSNTLSISVNLVIPLNPCGNGTIDSGEQCDGTNLNGQSCSSLSLGFTGGTLSCSSSCQLVTSSCTTSTGGSTLTIGNTTTGTVTDSNDSTYTNAVRFTTGASGGTAQSVSVYVASPIGTSPNNQYSLAIYSNSGTTPGTLIAQTSNGTLTGNAWNTLPITATLSPNTTYWLAYNTNGIASNQNNLRYNSGGTTGQTVWKGGQTFGTWPSSFGATSGNSSAVLTIYLTYTTGTPANSLTFLSLTTPTLDINLSGLGRSFSVSFFNPGDTTALTSTTVTGTASTITFTPANLSSGTYDVRVKRDGSLYRKKANLLLSNGTNLGTFSPLISGDLNADNAINALDWSMMSPDWFQTGRPSDINGDGITNALDFTWLNRNWFLIGE